MGEEHTSFPPSSEKYARDVIGLDLCPSAAVGSEARSSPLLSNRKCIYTLIGQNRARGEEKKKNLLSAILT